MAIGMAPPGIFDVVIKDTSIHFGNDDALLLYTDGVTEAVNPAGDEYSGERLLKLLRANGKESAQVILNRTLDSVQQFAAGADQVDDLTLIAIKHS